ncbi:uncharacterized protein B0T15DRAFT_538631 [Chaetomium strumarium]|uniref:Heterokaryon incompatibility domain-containing protein n=1 Tax=Chaetomium strumarium TaxID=1170767 RepID=A0AAJ0GN29_9PEZI|nr:hypothetical protein B0T15DRAFT_538631 [Chaetomium strumarium]
MAKFRERSVIDEGLWRDVLGIEAPLPVGGRRRSWAAAWREYWAFYRTRRYFHRAWIVQEVAVAGRLEMMAGRRGEELRWDDMYGFAEFLVETGWFTELDDLGDSWLEGLGSNPGTVKGFGITDIGTLQRQLRSRWFEKTGWPMYWWEVVTTVRKRDCFLKEDKVFATVGTLQQVLTPGTPLPFPVDAAATPLQVYVHAAAALLHHCPELPGLSFVDHQDYYRLPNLPSWVPDLTSDKYTNPIGTFFSGFKACVLNPDTVPPRHVTPAGELHLRGIKLDTLSFKTTPCAPLSTDFAIEALSFLATMPTLYAHANGRDRDGVLTPLFREAALVDALTCYQAANPYRGAVAETQRLLKGCRAWLVMALGSVYSGCLMREGQPWYDAATLAEYRGKWAKVEALIRGMGARALVPSVEEIREYGEEMMRARAADRPWLERIKPPTVFKSQIGSMMLMRCLFRTVEGRVGVCTQTCEPGDEVWFLEGGAVPYVLRPCKEEGGKQTYMFHGECCVVGAMYGELVESGHIVPDKLEDVVIR